MKKGPVLLASAGPFLLAVHRSYNTKANVRFRPIADTKLVGDADPMNISFFGLGLALFSLGGHPAHAAGSDQVSLVDKALMARCPNAQSEEVIECARQITSEADGRINRDLCTYRPDTCREAFNEFVTRRNELTISLERAINERSVVAQIEVALFALQTTLAFEEAGAFKERQDLEKR